MNRRTFIGALAAIAAGGKAVAKAVTPKLAGRAMPCGCTTATEHSILCGFGPLSDRRSMWYGCSTPMLTVPADSPAAAGDVIQLRFSNGGTLIQHFPPGFDAEALMALPMEPRIVSVRKIATCSVGAAQEVMPTLRILGL